VLTPASRYAAPFLRLIAGDQPQRVDRIAQWFPGRGQAIELEPAKAGFTGAV
jgi:hypothetical protein